MINKDSIFSEYVYTIEEQKNLSKKVKKMEKLDKCLGVLSNVVKSTGGIIGCIGAGFSVSLPEDNQKYMALGFGLSFLFAGGAVGYKIDKYRECYNNKIGALVDRWNQTESRQKEIEKDDFGLNFEANNNSNSEINLENDNTQDDEYVESVLEVIVLGEETLQSGDNSEESFNENAQGKSSINNVFKHLIDDKQTSLEE